MGDRLTLGALRQQACYQELPPKQRALVEAYLTNGGHKIKAMMSAFNCANEKTARVMSYVYFAKPKVVECLAVASGVVDPELAAFKETVRRAIINPKLSIAQLGALKVFAQLHGYLGTVPEPAPEAESTEGPQKFAIGSVIIQDGEKFLVVAQEID